MLKVLFAAVRTSEFWGLAFQAYIEATSAPVPEEIRWAAWAYIALRVVGKLAKFVFPSGSTTGAWLKSD